MIEDYLAAGRHFPELNARDVGPFGERGTRKCLLTCIQRADVDGDRAALPNVEMVAVAAPKSVYELVGDHVVTDDRWWRIGGYRNLVATSRCIVPGADIDVIGAAVGGTEPDLRSKILVRNIVVGE